MLHSFRFLVVQYLKELAVMVSVALIVLLYIALFKSVSTFPECALFDQTGAPYSAVEYTNAIVAVLRVVASNPPPPHPLNLIL